MMKNFQVMSVWLGSQMREERHRSLYFCVCDVCVCAYRSMEYNTAVCELVIVSSPLVVSHPANQLIIMQSDAIGASMRLFQNGFWQPSLACASTTQIEVGPSGHRLGTEFHLSFRSPK